MSSSRVSMVSGAPSNGWPVVRDRHHRGGPAVIVGATRVGNFSEQIRGDSLERHQHGDGARVGTRLTALRGRHLHAGMRQRRSTRARHPRAFRRRPGAHAESGRSRGERAFGRRGRVRNLVPDRCAWERWCPPVELQLPGGGGEAASTRAAGTAPPIFPSWPGLIWAVQAVTVSAGSEDGPGSWSVERRYPARGPPGGTRGRGRPAVPPRVRGARDERGQESPAVHGHA
jgi:hypothetical protein